MTESTESTESLTIDLLKSKVLFLLNQSDSMVSSIYTRYVRQFCSEGGSAAEFLIPNEALLNQPPNLQKVRLFLYQIMVRLETFSQKKVADPLGKDDYANVLMLIRTISPIAIALDRTLLVRFMDALKMTHGSSFPITIEMFERDLGMQMKEPEWSVNDHVERVHYTDRVKTKKKLSDLVQESGATIFPGKSASLGRSVKLRIKKSKHSPQQKSPLLSNKSHR